MSLFDVIKYPLSDPVTEDEYEALPQPIRVRYSAELLRRGPLFSLWVKATSEEIPRSQHRAHLTKALIEYNI